MGRAQPWVAGTVSLPPPIDPVRNAPLRLHEPTYVRLYRAVTQPSNARAFAKLHLGTRPFDGRFANMTKKLVLVLALGLSAMGCSSEADVICEKLDECNVLAGRSLEECVELVEKAGTEGERADCASCVEEKSCSTLTETYSCVDECAAVTADL